MRAIRSIRDLLANRPLAALVGAGAVSGIGDWMYMTALPVLVYQRTGDPALVGLAAIGRLIPFFLLSVPAGIAADRFPRRGILVVTESVRSACMLLVAGLCLAAADVGLMIALTVVAASAGSFSYPAQGSLTPELARDDAELGRANSIYSTLDAMACVVGPALAGVLIFLGGLPLAFALNGLSFAAMAAALIVWRPMTARAPARDDGAASAAEPAADLRWRALVRRIAGPLALDGAVSFGSASLSCMAVVIAVDWLGQDEPFTGALNAAGGLGGILGGVAAGLVINRRTRVGVTAAVVAFCVAVCFLGSAAQPALAIGAMVVAFSAIVMLDTLNTTAIQRLTEEGGTGRAFGLLHSLAALWMMAGIVVPTATLAIAGIQAAILAPALVMLALGGLAVAVHGGLPLRVAGPRPQRTSAIPRAMSQIDQTT